MKNSVLLLTAILLSTTGVFATSTNEDKVATRNAYNFNNSFIFVENGITFSVFPDGEFDFYIDNIVSGSRNGITFNSGFDYSPYAQYDDYGAVIQVENIPIFYDFYGRVNQIGSVDINYRNGRVRRIGGMSVYYNNRGFYDFHVGFINIYNRNYVYRPFHRWFARPAVNLCLVYNRPYRRFYTPVRYTYYNPYRFNTRRAYAQVGRTHRYNTVRRERANIYRNDNRVAVRNSNSRSSRTVGNRNNEVRRDRSIANNDIRSNRNTNLRLSTSNKRNNGNINRSNQSRTVTKREITRGNGNKATINRSSTVTRRNGEERTVTKREVTRTPRSTSVTRSTTYSKKPVGVVASGSTKARTERSAGATRNKVSKNTRSKAPNTVANRSNRGTSRSADTNRYSRRN